MDMKYCFLVLISLFFDISFAQPNHDYIWMFGDEGTDTLHSGLSLINFNQSLIEIKKVPYTGLNTKIYVSNATMSDADGNLAFYTNGCAIYNSEHQVMENGDEINPGDVHDDYCDIIGYPGGKQSCLALPWPDSSDLYLLFHQPHELISIPPFGFDFYFPFLYCSVIDMKKGNGMGEVVEKNQVIIQDTLNPGHITAVKHANGRDWWVLVPERQSARYHTLIVTPTGVVDTFSQEVGIPFLYEGEGSGQACFSPDGLKYMRYTYSDGLHLFDFDRQTGMLSNFFHIPGHPGTWSFGGAAFSPSGRYLYTIDLSDYLYQYDLWASDIAASKTLVAEYDGYKENNFWSTDFGDMQLGPDCRIYIATNPNTSYLHVIDNPDNPPPGVNVIQRAVKLPAKHQGLAIPNFPNYRLDSIPTYPCDSNIVLIPHDPSWVWERPAARERLQAWPNPSAGNFTLSLPQTAGRLVIFDPLGREVWRRELASHEKEIVVEAAGWAPGLYHCAFAGEDGRVFAVMVLVQLL
jgi:hypothetical protein